jgi:flagellar basal body-associated protein FliL
MIGIRSKKAQGLPIEIIILLALALIVLVILAFVFSSKIKDFMKSADDCKSKQGDCISQSEKCEGAIISSKECKTGEVCCIRVTSTG